MKLRHALLLACLVTTSSQALAAASQEEADGLKASFEKYLTNTPGVVTVAPEGDVYKVTIDVAPLAAKAGAPADSFSVSPQVFTLENKGDGKWNYLQDQPFTFVLKGPEIDMSVSVAAMKGEGVYDEALSAFSTIAVSYTDIAVAERFSDNSAGPVEVAYVVKKVSGDGKSVAAAAGGVDVESLYNVEGVTETIKMPANPAVGMPPMDIGITIEGMTFGSQAAGVRAAQVKELLAFFVAHQSKETLIQDQAKLKEILGTGLPLWELITYSGVYNNLNVLSPAGPITAVNGDFLVEMSGIVKEGRLRQRLGLTGLTLPPNAVPPQLAGMVPKEFSFDFEVKDFDLGTPAKLIIDKFDLSKDPPLGPEVEAELTKALLPNGAVTLVLNPSTIVSGIYNAGLQGTMQAGPSATPSGQASVKLKGMDEIIQTVQSLPAEMSMGQILRGLIAAKGLAKTDAEGNMTWQIESTPGGGVLVNGIDPSKM
jgi:hypothetical protein